MATTDAITLITSLKLDNGDLDSMNIPQRVQKIDQNTASPARVAGIQVIGTSEEALDLTDLTTNGIALFWNRDPANFVTIGVKPAATYYPLLRLKFGEAFPVRLEPGVTPYAKADTDAVKLERIILDD